MNKILKWIVVILSSLLIVFYLFIYFFLNEETFTRQSIRYYFLSDNMKENFIISPNLEPKYWQGDLDSRVDFMNVSYCSKLSKKHFQNFFYELGYTFYKNSRLYNKSHTVTIYIGKCEENNSLSYIEISEKE